MASSDTPSGLKVKQHPVWIRAGMVLLVLIIGIGGMFGLSSLRQAPPTNEVEPVIVRAEGMRVERQNVRTTLSGYGTSRPYRRSQIAPQVGGQVVSVHEELREGEVIEEGEVLFQIDPADYELTAEENAAEVNRLEKELERLEVEERNTDRLIEIARDMLAISEREYERTERLVSQDQAESESRLDNQRMELSRQQNSLITLENQKSLFESRRAQTQAQLKAAKSRLAKAELNLDRTRVRAPFTGRIEMEVVEIGQELMPGQTVATLADDTRLEIPVSMDSRDVSRWLQVTPNMANPNWFEPFVNRPVEIYWTERSDVRHRGQLDRIENFNERNRTFDVVVSMQPDVAEDPEFPITSGMFCEVLIPGKVAENVVPIPREAVDSDGSVVVSNSGKMIKRPVRVARYEKDLALVSDGLETGDVVLLQRPPNMVDGMNVEVNLTEEQPHTQVLARTGEGRQEADIP